MCTVRLFLFLKDNQFYSLYISIVVSVFISVVRYISLRLSGFHIFQSFHLFPLFHLQLSPTTQQQGDKSRGR